MEDLELLWMIVVQYLSSGVYTGYEVRTMFSMWSVTFSMYGNQQQLS